MSVAGIDTLQKLARVRSALMSEGLDGLWVTQAAHVAWLTDGARVHIHMATDVPVVSLFVTADESWAITNDVEAERLQKEEGMASWRFIVRRWTDAPWHPQLLLRDASGGQRLAVDVPGLYARNMHQELLRMRTPLLPGEQQRFRSLGVDAGTAVHDALAKLDPGLCEYAIAALVSQSLVAVGAEPVVLLVSSESRAHVRHPLPTHATASQWVMVVVCARRHGLVASLTRFVAWGPHHAAVQARLSQVAMLDAGMIARTRAGTSLSDIWKYITGAYAAAGLPDNWRALHQGGSCSYAPRDVFLTPDTPGAVQLHQAYAWNPSLPGAKSEDTLLVTKGGPEILTLGPWPTQTVTADGLPLPRPVALQN